MLLLLNNSMATKKCPACFGKIDLKATRCMHCGHQMTEAEMQAAESTARGNRIGCWFVIVALGGLLLYTCSGNDSMPSTSERASLTSQAAPPSERRQLQIDRFSWEAYGDRYCKASAKFTNTGDVDLRFVRVTLQFMAKNTLIGSETAYLDVQELPPGQSSTYDAMYECPGPKAEVEITAVSRGNVVEIVDAPKKR